MFRRQSKLEFATGSSSDEVESAYARLRACDRVSTFEKGLKLVQRL